MLRQVLDQEGARGFRRIRGREGRRYIARQLYKQGIVPSYRDADYLVDIYMKQRFDDSVQNPDEPLQEYEDIVHAFQRDSLDKDIPSDYFDKFRSVKKTILKKYGKGDRVQMILSRLNDEEKAKGKKADPNNILMKIQFQIFYTQMVHQIQIC